VEQHYDWMVIANRLAEQLRRETDWLPAQKAGDRGSGAGQAAS
jgi:hypothetical protein